MSRQKRILRYGASIAIALAGVACGATISGTLGGTLATALIGIGLVGIVSLVFYEVGLTEDRARAKEDRMRARAQEREAAGRETAGREPAGPAPPHQHGRPVPKRAARPGRLDRQRGERRRLR